MTTTCSLCGAAAEQMLDRIPLCSRRECDNAARVPLQMLMSLHTGEAEVPRQNGYRRVRVLMVEEDDCFTNQWTVAFPRATGEWAGYAVIDRFEIWTNDGERLASGTLSRANNSTCPLGPIRINAYWNKGEFLAGSLTIPKDDLAPKELLRLREVLSAGGCSV